MCGIFGTFNLNITEKKLTRCIDQLEHRGPDDRGVWMDEICGLAHRRLSILDLSSAGRQPMCSEDQRYYIVFNGEIYNFVELKSELELIGYQFHSNTDTEVVLYSYLEWKEECLNKFNGMWAFAIYDRYEKKVFLSRDRFGIKPLFFAKVGEGIAFGSEMKAIMPVLPVITPNYGILKDKDRYFSYEATAQCLINEIERLPAGHYAYIDKSGMKMIRWWNTLEHLCKVPDRYEEQVEMFRELFLDACKIRMRSDVTIGTALSGGLDSSATICSMAEIARRGSSTRVNHDFQHAFVAAFPGSVIDEAAYARIVTDYLKIDSTEVVIDPNVAIANMPEYIFNFEEVYATSPAPMMQLYGELKEGGVTVTLDGHGADELFGGYTGDMLYALLDSGADLNAIKEILTTYFSCIPTEEMPSNIVEKRAYKRCYADFMARHCAKKVLHVPTWDRLIDTDNKKVFNKLGHFERTLYNSTHTTILPTLLRNYDRYSMASGVEIRMPFMDYRIVQFAFSIPWKAKLHSGYSKCIIRDALRDIMPREIVERKQKIGFNTPIVEWMKGPWREWLYDMMSSSSFRQSDIVDAKETRRMIDKVVYSERPAFEEAEAAWMAFMPFLWEKYFLHSSELQKIYWG